MTDSVKDYVFFNYFYSQIAQVTVNPETDGSSVEGQSKHTQKKGNESKRHVMEAGEI